MHLRAAREFSQGTLLSAQSDPGFCIWPESAGSCLQDYQAFVDVLCRCFVVLPGENFARGWRCARCACYTCIMEAYVHLRREQVGPPIRPTLHGTDDRIGDVARTAMGTRC
jgi:hypothetical protein